MEIIDSGWIQNHFKPKLGQIEKKKLWHNLLSNEFLVLNLRACIFNLVL